MGESERSTIRMSAEQDAFEHDFHDWLQQAASSGKYPMKGVVMGWSLCVENVDPTREDPDEGGPDKMLFFAQEPGQRLGDTIKQHHIAAVIYDEHFRRHWFADDEGDED